MIIIDGEVIKDIRYPDNTFRLISNDNRWLSVIEQSFTSFKPLADPDTFWIDWAYEKPEELFMLQLLTRHLRDRIGAEYIHLVMPYVPNARMDRTKSLTGEINVLKYFCQLINEMNFASVTILDPHSDATVNQLDRVIVATSKPYGQMAFKHSKAKYICFPDKGALQRYRTVYNFAPFLNGEKVRDWKNGQVTGVVIENPMNLDLSKASEERILIMDDICSKGGTFWHAANALKELGFTDIDLYVTHCELAIFEGKLLDPDSPIGHVYTTNSICNRPEHEKITVYNVAVDEY